MTEWSDHIVNLIKALSVSCTIFTRNILDSLLREFQSSLMSPEHVQFLIWSLNKSKVFSVFSQGNEICHESFIIASTWKMSQLRKSASFRSRIPVRARLPQRRCSSPQPFSSSKSRPNKKNSKFFYDRYYSSSSFSSSDESHDSEEPLKVKILSLEPQIVLEIVFKSISDGPWINSHSQSDIKLCSHILSQIDETFSHVTKVSMATCWKRCEASINWFLLWMFVCWLHEQQQKNMKKTVWATAAATATMTFFCCRFHKQKTLKQNFHFLYFQSLFSKSVATAANSNVVSRSNVSTDAMSLNGLLDNVSTGSFSTQNSPQSTVTRGFQGLCSTLLCKSNYDSHCGNFSNLNSFMRKEEKFSISSFSGNLKFSWTLHELSIERLSD